PLMPGWYARVPAPAPTGAPAIFPFALAGAALGVFLFTTVGAAKGAEVPGGESSIGSATAFRAFLGGPMGMLPVGAWWLAVRHRAGKRTLAVIAVLGSCLSFTCLTGCVGLLTGSLQTTPPDAATFCKRGSECSENNDWAGAIVQYTKAIKLNPR